MSNWKPSGKSFDISKQEVMDAYKQVKEKKGAPGVDGVTIDDFEADLKNNLFKIWNRMSSGSYMAQPVRAVEMPKPHGDGIRVLGIPTVAEKSGPDGSSQQAGGKGRPDLSSRLLWLSPKQVRS